MYWVFENESLRERRIRLEKRIKFQLLVGTHNFMKFKTLLLITFLLLHQHVFSENKQSAVDSIPCCLHPTFRTLEREEYESGNIKSVAVYYFDVLDGDYRKWYENGNLMKLVPYSKGLVHGVAKTYYETGELFETIKFEKGMPLILIKYRRDGSVIEETNSIDNALINEIVKK